jgi:hypothetical protein
MRSSSLQHYWKMIVSLALVAGLGFGLAIGHLAHLGTRLLPHFIPSTPSVSAPPPRVEETSAGARVTAYAQVNGRTYHIVVGRQKGPNDEKGLWSAAYSAEEQPGDDIPSP